MTDKDPAILGRAVSCGQRAHSKQFLPLPNCKFETKEPNQRLSMKFLRLIGRQFSRHHRNRGNGQSQNKTTKSIAQQREFGAENQPGLLKLEAMGAASLGVEMLECI